MIARAIVEILKGIVMIIGCPCSPALSSKASCSCYPIATLREHLRLVPQGSALGSSLYNRDHYRPQWVADFDFGELGQ
jgi:hypothetical protein